MASFSRTSTNSRTPSSRSGGGGGGGAATCSSLSVGSDSSGIKPPYPLLFDHDDCTSLLRRSSELPKDPPLCCSLPSPGSSVRNFGEHLQGVVVSEKKGGNVGDDGSLESLKFDDSSLESWKTDDVVPSEAMIGASPYLPSLAKLRSCDVYIGAPSSKGPVLGFVKWLRAELELQGVRCFAVDRSKCKDAVGHSIVDKAMSSATFGVVIVSKRSFSNPYSMYELKYFLSGKNLVPIFFDLCPADCVAKEIIGKRGEVWEKYGGKLWKSYGGNKTEWKEVVSALLCMDGWKLEAYSDTWRDCILEAMFLLGALLGKRNVMEAAGRWMDKAKEEFPFPRNDKFVGRKKELAELELMLFGDLNENRKNKCFEAPALHRRKNAPKGRKTKSNNAVEKRSGPQTKGKELVLWKESDAENKMGSSKSRQKHHQTMTKQHTRLRYGKGIACVTGKQGIGKTELLLEYAYRFAQRYKMVLWVGGEAKYFRQNYLKLVSLLEIDVGIENQLSFDRNLPKNFKELEGEAIHKLRREFMRDIPFLIVIDNLESENDWWEAKSVMELLPRFGGETHIVISTRLPCVLNLEPLKLSYVSAAESMSLMKGRVTDMPVAEVRALRVIEEKLGRLTFGLALVGNILSEHLLSPQGLLDALNQMPDRSLIGREDLFFKHNPYLIRLIEICFFMFVQMDKLASEMTLASGWFAPSPIPISLLTLAALETSKTHKKGSAWKMCLSVVSRQSLKFLPKRSKVNNAANALVRLGFARAVTKHGYIQFHEIIKLYARQRGDTRVAYAMVQAIIANGDFPEHNEHIWAACFLIFKFGARPAVLKIKASEMVSFIKRHAAPLAAHAITNFSRYNAGLELLRVCTNVLEDMDEHFLSELDTKIKKSVCCGNSFTPTKDFDPHLYQESATLKATLLQKRAELMLQGGDMGIGEQLCRKSICIRDVIYGRDHPETISACNTLAKFLRSHANK